MNPAIDIVLNQIGKVLYPIRLIPVPHSNSVMQIVRYLGI